MSESKLMMSRKQLAVICHDDPDAIRLMERLAKVSAAFEGYLPDNLPYVTDADLESNVPELGSNSNGYWAKFPSGLLECYGGKSVSGLVNGSTCSFTFPISFIAGSNYQNLIIGAKMCHPASGGGYVTIVASSVTDNGFTVGIWSPPPGSYITYRAIGRWKS